MSRLFAPHGPVLLCAAMSLAGCAARAQDGLALAAARPSSETPLVLMVETPPMRISDADRARLLDLARRADDPDGRGATLTVTAGVEGPGDGWDERSRAAARARTVRDVLVDVGGIAPARVRTSIVDRPGSDGVVSVMLVSPRTSTRALPGSRPVAFPRASVMSTTSLAETGARPAHGFHASATGNGCVFARHDLDDFQPGGPFVPCAAPTTP